MHNHAINSNRMSVLVKIMSSSLSWSYKTNQSAPHLPCHRAETNGPPTASTTNSEIQTKKKNKKQLRGLTQEESYTNSVTQNQPT